MSVINKMLRDLDQRTASTLDPALRAGVRAAAVPHITTSVKARHHRALLWGAGCAALLVLGLAAWWLWLRPSTSLPEIVPGVAGRTQVVEPELQSAVQAPPAQPPAMATSVPVKETPALSHTDTAAPAKPAALAPVVTAEKPRPMAPSPESGGLKLASSASLVSSSSPATTAPVAVATAASGPDPVVVAQRQQNATRDVLAQAQALSSSGSQETAIQLLQDTLHTAERANPPAPAATQLQLLRELARMELAQGRAAAVLELLGRYEPLMVAQPDLWAVRANAAQRLGRHQDALQFYATALQARPAEQRWLLGSAVSQAALGQLVAAAELAEKARAIAPVSKEVLTYLRQQGVTLNDKP